MNIEHSFLQKVRFYTNTGFVYLLTIVFIFLAVRPSSSYKYVSSTVPAISPILPISPQFSLISGIPDRIVLPDSSWNGVGVDLLVDPGYYDASTDTWTLSGTRAQFDMYSSPANDAGGETYIYGHNNDNVFGALRHVTPAIGAPALVYTTNGHIFSYKFVSVSSVGPDTPSVLTYNGSPILIIQTCTGSFNEDRTLYRYDFQKVIK